MNQRTLIIVAIAATALGLSGVVVAENIFITIMLYPQSESKGSRIVLYSMRLHDAVSTDK